jgi:hypothetical protein
MKYLIYSVKGKSGNLEYEGQVYDEKSAKAALDSFYYRLVGGTYYQRKTLVAIPANMEKSSWSDLGDRYRSGKNIRLRRSKMRR